MRPLEAPSGWDVRTQQSSSSRWEQALGEENRNIIPSHVVTSKAGGRIWLLASYLTMVFALVACPSKMPSPLNSGKIDDHFSLLKFQRDRKKNPCDPNRLPSL